MFENYIPDHRSSISKTAPSPTVGTFRQHLVRETLRECAHSADGGFRCQRFKDSGRIIVENPMFTVDLRNWMPEPKCTISQTAPLPTVGTFRRHLVRETLRECAHFAASVVKIRGDAPELVAVGPYSCPSPRPFPPQTKQFSFQALKRFTRLYSYSGFSHVVTLVFVL